MAVCPYARMHGHTSTCERVHTSWGMVSGCRAVPSTGTLAYTHACMRARMHTHATALRRSIVAGGGDLARSCTADAPAHMCTQSRAHARMHGTVRACTRTHVRTHACAHARHARTPGRYGSGSSIWRSSANRGFERSTLSITTTFINSTLSVTTTSINSTSYVDTARVCLFIDPSAPQHKPAFSIFW